MDLKRKFNISSLSELDRKILRTISLNRQEDWNIEDFFEFKDFLENLIKSDEFAYTYIRPTSLQKLKDVAELILKGYKPTKINEMLDTERKYSSLCSYWKNKLIELYNIRKSKGKYNTEQFFKKSFKALDSFSIHEIDEFKIFLENLKDKPFHQISDIKVWKIFISDILNGKPLREIQRDTKVARATLCDWRNRLMEMFLYGEKPKERSLYIRTKNLSETDKGIFRYIKKHKDWNQEDLFEFKDYLKSLLKNPNVNHLFTSNFNIKKIVSEMLKGTSNANIIKNLNKGESTIYRWQKIIIRDFDTKREFKKQIEKIRDRIKSESESYSLTENDRKIIYLVSSEKRKERLKLSKKEFVGFKIFLEQIRENPRAFDFYNSSLNNVKCIVGNILDGDISNLPRNKSAMVYNWMPKIIKKYKNIKDMIY